ncbi:DUF3152 domain-containing protein [Streptomyces sp. MI02-7b]|uniref:DUF3152 domain-containing protein n=1 Tax=Streptomyces sp. MI02-7b TaxID=462941 RepID=UPI0029A1C105|nr:DUF3152 domain-containing protein [Streptomyces sp. MI02-7b]MDX3077753.1 DUF3152 domain-containing protein [Streptomyces sp. MI02-7b]
MGRHSAPGGRDGRRDDTSGGISGGSGNGRRRRGPATTVPPRPAGPGTPAPGGWDGFRPGDTARDRQEGSGHGHPEHREHSAWGRTGSWAPPRTPRGARPADLADSALAPEDLRDSDAADDPADTGGRPAGLLPRQRTAPPPPGRRIPGPRKDFVAAFDAAAPPDEAADAGDAVDAGDAEDAPKKGSKARAFTGTAAAAVVTVLAVVVAGQLYGGHDGKRQAAAGTADASRAAEDSASRSQDRATPSTPPSVAAAPLTYDQAMARQYPLDKDLHLSGAFQTVGGHQNAPGGGKRLRVRVDVEKGLPLDGRLFADAVFTTLNDKRSWAHDGARSFERVSTGHADIVITLASPGTTAKVCAESGLDTTVDNVSCDAASTPRTMINAFRWAQGSPTYGPARMHAYRQMLINHEVGHRLGYNHVLCPKNGALAPVMMQQTKFLTIDGLTCKPNAWPYPRG